VRFGCESGPLCLDVEYSTYTGNVAGALAYMAAWAAAVHQRGYLPVQYAVLRTASDYQPTFPTGLWIADWDGKGDLTKFPNASRFTGIGWQFSDNWHGFDVSHVDGAWWQPVAVLESAPDPDHIYFPETQHYLSLGFKAFWQANGGLPIFGYPISEEFDENGVTVQYFERARFELHPDFDGNPYHVQLGLIGADVAAAAKLANPDAFKPAAAP